METIQRHLARLWRSAARRLGLLPPTTMELVSLLLASVAVVAAVAAAGAAIELAMELADMEPTASLAAILRRRMARLTENLVTVALAHAAVAGAVTLLWLVRLAQTVSAG